MVKPIPEELAEEDDRLTKLFIKEKPYDDVDGFIRRNASKEYVEWISARQKAAEEAESKGLFI